MSARLEVLDYRFNRRKKNKEYEKKAIYSKRGIKLLGFVL